MDNRSHYDKVTDAWMYILGDNLHFGYFDTTDTALPEATDALIDKLASLERMDNHSSVLDVGCGIGAPALYLHEKFGCTINGISISPRGIEVAEEKCRKKGYSDKIAFHVRDALDNRFPDNSFDIAWVMESSLLMRDKARLFEENYRVLKENGSMLLCDMILRREFTVMDVFKYQKELAVLEKSFGKNKIETLGFYEAKMGERGFRDIESVDVSTEAFPTLTKWRENILDNKEAVLRFFSEDDFDSFLLSCDILTDLFNKGIFGYGLVRGVK